MLALTDDLLQASQISNPLHRLQILNRRDELLGCQNSSEVMKTGTQADSAIQSLPDQVNFTEILSLYQSFKGPNKAQDVISYRYDLFLSLEGTMIYDDDYILTKIAGSIQGEE